ncbi:MAG: tRNA lysidine(34) synthetase TilS [Hyphomonadaceae bacterium]|nr:tRNA lysidine(34) synthetase TilS [Hyphomonadaceae bacterium]
MPSALPLPPSAATLRADLALWVARTLPAGAPILAAASGGGDSMALVLLLAPVAKAQGRALAAVVVDHALRPGSDAAAAEAAELVSRLGADAHVLRLDWAGGPRTAQVAAREARYAALAAFARRIGAPCLFLGHTADDQAETVLLRQQAGSGPRGLAGMAALAPCPVWPAGRDLWLARPLLGVRRAELRALLRAAGAPWLEDPANALVRYARVRARAALAAGGSEPLIALAARHAIAAAATDAQARAWLATGELGEAEARLAPPVPADPAHRRALAAVAASYGGARREPADAAVLRLAERLAKGFDGTLAGARFRAGVTVRVSRDPGGLAGRRGGARPVAPLPLPPGDTVVWDRRLALTAPVAGFVAAPPRASGDDAPEIAGPAGQAAAVERRWLTADRVGRLLHRGA